MKTITKKEQIKRSKNFSKKINYTSDIPIKIQHVNPSCNCGKNDYHLHGELPSASYSAKINFKLIEKERKRFLWKRDVILSIILGTLIGVILITNL
jgi:hypothetical protein